MEKQWTKDRKEQFTSCSTTCSTKDVLMKYQDICSENKPCVVNITDGKSFVNKDFYQKNTIFLFRYC